MTPPEQARVPILSQPALPLEMPLPENARGADTERDCAESHRTSTGHERQPVGGLPAQGGMDHSEREDQRQSPQGLDRGDEGGSR